MVCIRRKGTDQATDLPSIAFSDMPERGKSRVNLRSKEGRALFGRFRLALAKGSNHELGQVMQAQVCILALTLRPSGSRQPLDQIFSFLQN